MKRFTRLGMVCILILIIPLSNALGMTGAYFWDAEPGKTYSTTIRVYTSSGEQENHFVMEKGGNVSDWLEFSPMEFDLSAGESKEVNVTLRVPWGTEPGEYNGYVKAAGQNIMGEDKNATIGFTVATKAVVVAKVIKPKGYESIAIVDFNAPESITKGDTVQFEITLKNNGTLPLNKSVEVIINQDSESIANLNEEIELDVGEEKTVKIYWDTQEVRDGDYEAFASLNLIGNVVKSNIKTMNVRSKLSSLSYLLILVVISTAIVLIIRHLKRRR